MPWTPERYPPAMRSLGEEVRMKAIEIANAMIADGIEEGQAIRMAIAAARRWARGHGGGGSASVPISADSDWRFMR
jgi:uncharacterized protein YdaT